jgi:hypothetical protein
VKRAPYRAKKGAEFAIYACYMAANPRLSEPGAFFAEELKIAFLTSEGSRVSGQSQQLVCPTNHTKDSLSGSVVLELAGSRVVRKAIHFSPKMVAIVGWPSELLYYKLDTLEPLMPPIALHALKISLPSAASSHHNQLFCLASFIALK